MGLGGRGREALETGVVVLHRLEALVLGTSLLKEQHQHAKTRDDQRGPEEARAPAEAHDQPGGDEGREDRPHLVAGAPDAHDRPALPARVPVREGLCAAGPAGGLSQAARSPGRDEKEQALAGAEGYVANAHRDQPHADESFASQPVSQRAAEELPDRVGDKVRGVHASQSGVVKAKDVGQRGLGDRVVAAPHVVDRIGQPGEGEGLDSPAFV